MLKFEQLYRFSLLCFLSISSLSARSQMSREWTPGAIPMGSQIGLYTAFPIVKDQPYTAEIVRQQTTVLLDGTRGLSEAHTVARRDSSGRLLDELLASPHVKHNDTEFYTNHHFLMNDPVRLLSLQWGDGSRTVSVSSIHVPPATSSSDYSAACPPTFGYATVEQQPLGERRMHGVLTLGCRTTAQTTGEHPITVTIETWQSPTLRIPLLTTEQNSDGWESRMEVISLELGEPDLAMFQPPGDYKIVKLH